MIVPRQIPPPPTLATDWLPDYQRPAPIIYRPRTPRPGTPSQGVKTGRPLGGKHPEKRRAQWRAAKARAMLARCAVLLLATLLHAGEWVPIEVTATAYCPCAHCCGERAVGLTADGTDVREWPYGIAVDPRWLPYGTPILVPHGHGYLDQQSPTERVWYADDTGGVIRRRTRATGRPHIDLRFRQHGNAVRFGIRTITILVWRDAP